MAKKLLVNNHSSNELIPIQDGLVCWLDVDSYHELIWQDKTSNKKIFKTPSVKDIVDGMIQFNRRQTDYFLCEDMDLDWNSTTIQIQLKDMIEYGDSSIITVNDYDGFQLSTTNALGHNKLRLNKSGGRCMIIKDIDLSSINNFVTCIFSKDFIGLGIDDNEIQRQNSNPHVFESKNFKKVCIGNKVVAPTASAIKGKFGSILIYNRVLTTEEIKHNCLYIKSLNGGV